jgi:hypothetical protein
VWVAIDLQPTALAARDADDGPGNAPRLVPGTPYTLDLDFGISDWGPYLGTGISSDYARGRSSSPDTVLAFRTFMRPPRPKWSHPTG